MLIPKVKTNRGKYMIYLNIISFGLSLYLLPLDATTRLISSDIKTYFEMFKTIKNSVLTREITVVIMERLFMKACELSTLSTNGST